MANKIHDAFENVQADVKLKESTMQFLADKRRKKMPFIPYLPIRRTLLAAACMMAVLITGTSGYSWLLAPVSYVSIDVNPSVELGLNRLDRVVSAAAYNPQGEELLEKLTLKGKTYVQAIYLIAGSDALQRYLAPDEELVITVAADSSREDALKEGVEGCCGQIGNGCRSVSADLDVVPKAHENGLSLGKYSAYLQLAQYDDSVTVDECREMSMAEIHCRILTHVHGSGHGHEGHSETGDASRENEKHPETGGASGENGKHPETGDASGENEKHPETGDMSEENEKLQEEQAGGQEEKQETGSQGRQHRRRQGHHSGEHE